MGNISNLEMRCCAQEDRHGHWNSELFFEQGAFQEHGAPAEFHCGPGCRSSFVEAHEGSWAPSYQDEGECQDGFGMQDLADATLDTQRSLEALSYTPGGFDQGATFDEDRSHARYSKIVAHSTRARTHRRSRAWEEWLRGAAAGRSITLLGGSEGEEAETRVGSTKVQAMYHVNRDLTKLSILPSGGSQEAAIVVPIDDIQVICPAADYKLFYDCLDTEISAAEKAMAVLVQYAAGDEHRRVCFLEESELAKDSFVQALTALWLEKRSNHSMWF